MSFVPQDPEGNAVAGSVSLLSCPTGEVGTAGCGGGTLTLSQTAGAASLTVDLSSETLEALVGTYRFELRSEDAGGLATTGGTGQTLAAFSTTNSAPMLSSSSEAYPTRNHRTSGNVVRVDTSTDPLFSFEGTSTDPNGDPLTLHTLDIWPDNYEILFTLGAPTTSGTHRAEYDLKTTFDTIKHNLRAPATVAFYVEDPFGRRSDLILRFPRFLNRPPQLTGSLDLEPYELNGFDGYRAPLRLYGYGSETEIQYYESPYAGRNWGCISHPILGTYCPVPRAVGYVVIPAVDPDGDPVSAKFTLSASPSQNISHADGDATDVFKPVPANGRFEVWAKGIHYTSLDCRGVQVARIPVRATTFLNYKDTIDLILNEASGDVVISDGIEDVTPVGSLSLTFYTNVTTGGCL